MEYPFCPTINSLIPITSLRSGPPELPLLREAVCSITSTFPVTVTLEIIPSVIDTSSFVLDSLF